MERDFELKLAGGRCVIWSGTDPIDAAHRYVAMYPTETIVAWRHINRHGLHVGVLPIVEPPFS